MSELENEDSVVENEQETKENVGLEDEDLEFSEPTKADHFIGQMPFRTHVLIGVLVFVVGVVLGLAIGINV